jgi:hypothetical protein
MRQLARPLAAVVFAILAVLVPAAAASAKQPAPARWAKRHHLKGHWQSKDADRDGLSNLREYKLATDPRRADTDRDGLGDADELRAGDDPLEADTDGDGIEDGAEHAGVVTAFDGTTLTVRQFHGGTLTAAVDPDVDCYSAGDDVATDDGEDTSANDAGDDDPTIDDVTDDTEPTCADAGVAAGAVGAHLELDSDDAGNLVVYEIELAG